MARTLDPSRHVFTGASDGDHRGGADPSAVPLLLASLHTPGPLVTVRQVHGARVVDAETADGETEADGLVSGTPGLVVAVRVADCVPILLDAPGAVAALHAGWRGTAADITRIGLDALCARSGATPRRVRAAIGPAICGRCYEVGPEVVDAVAGVAVGDAWRDGRHVDLAMANAGILVAAGVEVEIVGHCTRCTPGYWSHRGQGAMSGRQVGAIRC